MREELSITVVQHSAGADVITNMARVHRLIEDGPPSDLIALPEVFAIRGGEDDYRGAAEPVGGPTTAALAAIARRRKSWVLAGSILEREGESIYNTSILLNRRGETTAVYRKIHLFTVYMEDGTVVREDTLYRAGSQPTIADVEGWTCGLSICYDLRFPELYREYSRRGAELLFAPSNFTQRTGRDHWEILIRARAIENQCFVVAPNQCGANAVTGVASHGHSMIVGPWGEILAEAGTDECVLQAVLPVAMLKQTRARVPALKHRRL